VALTARIALLVLVALLPLAPACREVLSRVDRSQQRGPTEPKPAPAARRGPSAVVNARHWTVSYRLDPSAIGSFAVLKTRERQNLEHLINRSWVEWQVFSLDGRLLVRPPRNHPLGTVELLLAEDLERLIVFSPQRRRRFSTELERFPDLLDGVPASARVDFGVDRELDHRGSPTTPADYAGLERRVRVRSHRTAITLRYRPQARRPRAWPLRLELRLVFPDEPLPWPGQRPLLHIALPLLQNPRGRLVLEGLACGTGTPVAWSSTLQNEGKPSKVAPTLHARVRDNGYSRLRPELFEEERPGYRSVRATPGGREPGAQLVPSGRLAPLRREKPPEGGKGLVVDNRAAHAAYVYVDGLLLGWVGPRRSMTFTGLPAGYYRVFCVTPTTVRSWGPRDLYVPGPVVLR
jgi:hypothetical protein